MLTLALRTGKGLLWMYMSGAEKPFQGLGHHLKYVRQQAKQSLAEVSGAVEIDEKYLERIEAGLERPAEDILLLLISHFGVKDREAVQLWELANYDSGIPEEIKPEGDLPFGNKPVVMLLAVDMRTVYSDGLEVVTNQSGVTLNFSQSSSPTQATPVARIGMSHQQAEAVIETLQHALLHAKYGTSHKLLPPPSNP